VIGVAPDEVAATNALAAAVVGEQCASSRLTPATYKAMGIAVVGASDGGTPSWSRARVT
jgi:hypothetical protein